MERQGCNSPPPERPPIPIDAQEELSWAHTRLRQKARLTYLQVGRRCIPHVTMQSTSPETDMIVRRRYLMNALEDAADGVDTHRVQVYFVAQGLRITPYRFAEATDPVVVKHFDDISDFAGAYKPGLDIALVRRLPHIEAVNGLAWLESILVHELAHGSSDHHHVVYRQLSTQAKPAIHHGRGGHRVYDCHYASRGRFLEEAYAEHVRGHYVEHVLKLPQGFAGDAIDTDYFVDEGARIDLRYTIYKTSGKPYVTRESLAGQTLDHLCQLDPDLDADLRLARTSAEGLRNVAKRINAIKPGLYLYLRDTPLTRKDFRQRLIYVQRWLWHLHRSPTFR